MDGNNESPATGPSITSEEASTSKQHGDSKLYKDKVSARKRGNQTNDRAFRAKKVKSKS